MRYSGGTIRGFTLIELMISLVIGALVISAGLSVYVQMSASRSLLRAELALQENSYYINQTLRQLLNQAGHRPLLSSLLPTPQLPILNVDESFSESGGSTGGGEGDTNSGNSVTKNSWNTGEFIKVEDNGIAIRFNGSSDVSDNADGTIIDCQGRAVAEDDTIDVRFTVDNGSLVCTSDGVSVDMITEADGILIERIEALWGLDTNNDDSVDEYRAATIPVSSSEALLSVRVLMLLSSRDEVSVNNAEYFFNGIEYSSPDSRLRREAVTTVQIKN